MGFSEEWGSIFGHRSRFLVENLFLPFHDKFIPSLFFSLLKCTKSVFQSFPILYDISAFISRADRRNWPGGLEDL